MTAPKPQRMKIPQQVQKALAGPPPRMPMSFWIDRGSAPPDSYWPQYQAFLRQNPHHELNHPEHPANRKQTRIYDIGRR